MPGRLTLHDAMVVVLDGEEWLSLDEVAERIAVGDLYRRGDGEFARGDQVRRRAVQSDGRYRHLFEVDGRQIRLK
jgi:hypothetical protein